MISRPLWAAIAGLGVFTLSLAPVPPAFGGAPAPCGEVGQDCCPSQPGPDCQPGGTCVGVTCVSCGGVGELCCGAQCDAGLTCLPEFTETLSGQGGGAAPNPSICQPCGGSGRPCCDSECNSGFICEPCFPESIAGQGGGAGRRGCVASDICEPCGGLNQACCEGEVCNEGFDCDVGPGETVDQGSGAIAFTNCLPCGALGIQCCGEGTCLGEDLLCGGALCEACGAVGEQCCEDNTCPASDGICIEGTCEALPPAAAMTKSGLTALILTLTAVGLLWMRPAVGRRRI